ncbi:MAG: hypothetical protein RQ745_02085 [Longimicrobiales bacterium]|nr:hypothetical protein [Longimicrobiales bacterium]
MPIHDEYLRRTPFERLLPDADFLDRHADAIAAEARTRGVGLEDPGAFAMLESVGGAVEALRRPDADAGTTHTHAILLFHAWHLHRDGAPHRLVTTSAARWCIEAAIEPRSAEADSGVAGPEALYWQLPQHLFWVRSDPEASPTSLDGFFRTVTGESVHVLGVMNLLDGAPGFEVLPVPPAPLADLPGWATIRAREGEEEDFTAAMPGAELEGLYEVRNVGEVLKLVSRLERLARAEGALVEGGPATAEARPAPSVLDHERLILVP